MEQQPQPAHPHEIPDLLQVLWDRYCAFWHRADGETRARYSGDVGFRDWCREHLAEYQVAATFAVGNGVGLRFSDGTTCAVSPQAGEAQRGATQPSPSMPVTGESAARPGGYPGQGQTQPSGWQPL